MYHTVALTKEGKVYTWGDNSNGQLGHGVCDSMYISTSKDMPTQVLSLDGLIVIKIACGTDHTVVVTDKGEVFTWYVRL
jgi:alpha-tubulin suppressor-like RCC1 family protein